MPDTKITVLWLILLLFGTACEPIVIVRELPDDQQDEPIFNTPTPLPSPTTPPAPSTTAVAQDTPTPFPTATATATPFFNAPTTELARFGRGLGRDIAGFGNLIAVGSSTGVWLYDNWQPPRFINTRSDIQQVAFTADGTLVTLAQNGLLQQWQINDGNRLNQLDLASHAPHRFALSPDGQAIAIGTHTGKVQIWQRTDNTLLTEIAPLQPHSGRVTDLVYALDGQWLAIGYAQGDIQLWRTDGNQQYLLIEHDRFVTTLAFSADSQTLVSGDFDGQLRQWGVTNGILQNELPAHDDSIKDVVFTANNRFLSADDDGLIRVWNQSAIERTLPTDGQIEKLVASETSIIVRYRDHSLREYQLDGSLIRQLNDFSTPVRALKLANNSQWVAIAGDDNTAQLWQLSDQTLRHTFSHDYTVTSLDFSRDSTVLATGSHDSTVKLWRTADGSLIGTLPQPDIVLDVAFSPHGDLLAVAMEESLVHLVQLSDGAVRHALNAEGAVNNVAFTSDGTLLVTGGADVRYWQVGAGSLLRTQAGTLTQNGGLALSPDNNLLATAGNEQLTLWQVQDSQRLRDLRGHTAPATAVNFHPNGTLLASASEDGTLQIWQTTDGSLRQVIAGHTGLVTALDYSADGRQIASGSSDGTVRLWQVE